MLWPAVKLIFWFKTDIDFFFKTDISQSRWQWMPKCLHVYSLTFRIRKNLLYKTKNTPLFTVSPWHLFNTYYYFLLWELVFESICTAIPLGVFFLASSLSFLPVTINSDLTIQEIRFRGCHPLAPGSPFEERLKLWQGTYQTSLSLFLAYCGKKLQSARALPLSLLVACKCVFSDWISNICPFEGLKRHALAMWITHGLLVTKGYEKIALLFTILWESKMVFEICEVSFLPKESPLLV